MTYVRVWKFRPPQDREREFAEAYSANGCWAELFARAPGFRSTSLLGPAESSGWWMTIDRWDSAADFEAFQNKFGEEYSSLDARLEGVAGEEAFLGAFQEGR